MLEAMDAFLRKWFNRLKIFSFLAAIWAVFFSVFTIAGLRVGFEYDDGLSFSTPAFQSAKKEKTEPPSQDYWSSVNRSHSFERAKPAVWLSAWFFKAFGFKIDIFCQREPAGSDTLVRSWKPLADNFYFTPEEDQKYQLLEKNRFVLYFAGSDGGIIQARKAGVAAVRIWKSKNPFFPTNTTPASSKSRFYRCRSSENLNSGVALEANPGQGKKAAEASLKT